MPTNPSRTKDLMKISRHAVVFKRVDIAVLSVAQAQA
jgi:hypothetical protein